ncbi:B12-binding domain-containing radical SAM protein [Desulfomonile tiedjei]|uniref:Fe-S oxidoreductase n=1 Tax=Desulfomonile tiedjei (strain ATCC 49306 / DSM 6799 / DCB-1) TaxID=706587 RepID=I4CA04_DESTA|nr:B12-binding domain-containing radical SAM protein [Desulfomonile tiedjei]AFM26395.1 Fe-S oxidoreductase [Desulfomonile tiedjei DSM 6799]
MKALLVYPAIPDTFWSFKHILKFIRKRAAHVPLGLLTIASMLPEDWQLRLIDMNAQDLSDRDIAWADVVLIGAMVIQRESVKDVASRAKAAGKLVIAGGPLFSSMWNEFDEIDHFVLSEAEITLPLFLEDFQAGRAKRVYDSDIKPDITKTPLPKWELLNMKLYASMSVQYSRGCPFDCEFCDIVNLNGRRPRVKSNEQMVREFEILYNLGWRGRLFIVDDNFIGNRVKVKSTLRTLTEWQIAKKYPFSLFTEASVNLAQDEELMQLMTSAGFDSVFLGLETPAEESLMECGKHQNRSVDLLEAVKTIQRHGMEVMGGFIIGFDNDPPNIFERQIKFIQNSGISKAMIGLLNAIPGTRLYKRLQSEGRLIQGCTGDNCDGSLNFIPKMDAQILRDGYQTVLNYIYSPREYYDRVLEFLKDYRPVRRRRLQLLEIRAFFNSILYLGILDKGKNKIYYWKLLIKAFLFHRQSFGEAVSHAIFGYHFRKLLKK